MKLFQGRGVQIGLVMGILLLMTLACSFLPGSNKAASTPPKIEAKATALVQPTETAPQAETNVETPEEIQPTETLVDNGVFAETAIPAPTESWRIAPMPGAQLVATDLTKDLDPTFKSAMDKQARNLAIPKPYYFEYYVLPKDTISPNVVAYYDEQITAAGFKKAFNDTDSRGISLTTWLHNSIKTRKYVVQFIPPPPSYEQDNPVMFIIYSKPPKE